MVKHLYIVANGQFEISIKTFEDRETDDGQQHLLGFLRPAGDPLGATSSPPVRQSAAQTKQQRIMVVGNGNLLGLEDIARIQPHSYSVSCESQKGVLLKIDVERFH